VAQYIVLIIAYLTPVVWLGIKHTGIPVPQIAYGYTIQKLTDVEKKITADPKEIEVRKIFADRAAAGKAALANPDKAYAEGKAKVEQNLASLKAANAPAEKIAEAEKAVAACAGIPRQG
jgi:cation/acetate symporter